MTAPVALWGPAVVPNAAGTIYTCPNNLTVVINRAILNNIGGAAEPASVWLVRSGGSRDDGHLVLGASGGGFTIAAATDTFIIQGLAGLVLAPGDTIQMLAGAANAFTTVGSGWVTTP